MKPIKRRIDIRLKKRLFEKVKEISEAQDKTWTDIIETALEYGLKWYEAKIKRELANQEKQPVQSQENNTPDDNDDKTITREELDKLLEQVYAKQKKKQIKEDPYHPGRVADD